MLSWREILPLARRPSHAIIKCYKHGGRQSRIFDMEKKQYIEAGRIVNTHGVRGVSVR